jgi:hypothetical protein
MERIDFVSGVRGFLKERHVESGNQSERRGTLLQASIQFRKHTTAAPENSHQTYLPRSG